MSIVSYFCFCCLSTNDLANLCCSSTGINYVNLLKELMSIKPSQGYEEESYICEECIEKLKDAHSFRCQVLESINVLQVNGLIELRKCNGELLIEKVCGELFCDEKDTKIATMEDADVGKNSESTDEFIKDTSTQSTPSIKQEIEPKTEDLTTDTRKLKYLKCPIKDPVTIKLERDANSFRNVKKRDKSLSYVVAEDLKCPVCLRILPNVYTYHLHMNRHFPNHICTECGKGFLNEQKLKRHNLTHQTGPYKCDFCDRVFHNYSTFYGHKMRRHTTVPRYSCPHCRTRFATPSKRFRHLEDVHGQPRAHVCPTCGKRFMNSAHLNLHQRRLHLKEKRFVCKECDAGFFMEQDLVGHMASHQGAKMYTCTLCPKSYLRKNALKVHLRLHNNDRPFSCDVCGASFTQKATLMKHLKTHEANRSKKKIKNT